MGYKNEALPIIAVQLGPKQRVNLDCNSQAATGHI